MPVPKDATQAPPLDYFVDEAGDPTLFDRKGKPLTLVALEKTGGPGI